MSDLWQDLISIWKGHMSFLYGKSQMTDCKFILGEGEDKLEIKLHKMVLASCSAKFFNLWCANDEINQDDIIIRDVSSEALNAFVYYLYNENVDLNMEIVWDILKLAKVYEVKSLTDFCANFLKNIEKPYWLDIFLILEYTSYYGLDDVETQCFYNLSFKSDIMFCCTDFNTIKQDVFKKLINLDDFPGTELEIYSAVNRWSGKQCELKQIEKSSENKRSFLGDCARFNLKFKQMTTEEFKSIDNDDSFLTTDERMDISNSISPNFVRTPLSKLFLTSFQDQILKVENVNISSVYFTCDPCPQSQPYILYGFVIFGKTTASIENVSFFLKKKLNGNTLIEDKMKLEYNGTPKQYKIMFETPITLEVDIEYHLGIKDLDPSERFCATEYEKSIDCLTSFSYTGAKLKRYLFLNDLDYEDEILIDENDDEETETIYVNITACSMNELLNL